MGLHTTLISNLPDNKTFRVSIATSLTGQRAELINQRLQYRKNVTATQGETLRSRAEVNLDLLKKLARDALVKSGRYDH